MIGRVVRGFAGLNAVAAGCLFGVLQGGMFLLLQASYAATALVYLLATLAWLAGSAVGLLWSRRMPEWRWIGCALVGYFALLAIGRVAPYDLRAAPLLLTCVAVSGAYAGQYFRIRAVHFSRPNWLFFLENTGFVVGLIAVTLGLFLEGDEVLVNFPLLAAFANAATNPDWWARWLSVAPQAEPR